MGQLAYIGLGSNLGESAQVVAAAMVALGKLPGCAWVAGSSLWSSKPLAGMPQPDYVNAVAALNTVLAPIELLDALQAVEYEFGRTRGARWAARTLDLDLLLFGSLVLNTERLIVPHPGLALRDFVLWPLAELDPELAVPELGNVRALLGRCEWRGLRRIRAQSDTHRESI